MSFPQLASDSGYGGLNDFFLRCMNSPDQNADGRKNDENDPSHSCRFSFKTNEGNTKRKAKICRKHFWNLQKMEKCTTAANSVIQIKDQYHTTTKEVGVRLIALADAFDAEFFGDLSVSKKCI